MKHIFRIMPLFATVWLAAGCGDKGYDVAATPTFEIKSADVEYGASGGSGKITLDIPGGGAVEVSSAKDWCRVALADNTVGVTVDPHASIASREAVVTITRGGYTRRIGIFQGGTLFYVLEYGKLGDKVGNTVAIPFHTAGTLDVAVQSTPEWAAAAWDGGKLVVTATQDGNKQAERSGNIELMVNGKPKTLPVTQKRYSLYAYFIGDYVLTSYDNVNAAEPNSYDVSIVVKEEEESCVLTGLKYDIEMTYADGVFSFFTGGQTVAAGVVFRTINNSTGQSQTATNHMYSTYEIVDGKYVITLNCSRYPTYTGFAFYGSSTYLQRHRKEIKLYQK